MKYAFAIMGAWIVITVLVGMFFLAGSNGSSPQDCAAPHGKNMETITVHPDGNATTPYTGGTGEMCNDGTWLVFTPGQ